MGKEAKSTIVTDGTIRVNRSPHSVHKLIIFFQGSSAELKDIHHCNKSLRTIEILTKMTKFCTILQMVNIFSLNFPQLLPIIT